jgi:hypothetical protein
MLVSIKIGQRVDRLGRTWSHEIIVLRCDVCDHEWETRGSKTRIMSRKTHTCSPKCKSEAHKSGGIIERRRAATNVERYGAENAYAAQPCKEKMRQTWLEKYGVEHARSAPEVKQKCRDTLISRYGEHPIASAIIQERTKKTMLEKYGVEHPMQLERVREAMRVGSIAKYGVPYPKQNKAVQKAAFEKRVREGTFFKSKIEDSCYETLCAHFGAYDIERQVTVNKERWCIDFYVKSIDVYVQFDGLYWHALEKSIEEIRQSGLAGNKHDMARYRKWLVDRQQDTWFLKRHLRLVRISDKEFKVDPAACLLKIAGLQCHDFSSHPEN